MSERRTSGFMRLLRHMLSPGWLVRRAFRAADMTAIEHAVAESEARHRGEVRFVVEGAMPLAALLRGQSARARAIELFSGLRVWDTEENSGVLIYVQFVDHRVEIVADRGIAARVPQAEWDAVARQMEQAFRAGAWRQGALDAIGRVAHLLVDHFPARTENLNELPDRPVLL